MTFRPVEEPPTGGGVKVGIPMPCTFCGAMTSHATLAMLGARCAACYGAYCRATKPMPFVPETSIPPDAGGRAWAYRLRYREQTGERLTAFQRDAWRLALKPRSTLEQQP